MWLSGQISGIYLSDCLVRYLLRRTESLSVKSPTNGSQVRGRDGSAAILAAKRSAGVAPQMNLRERVM